jgi:hypothetical protein
MHFFNSRTYVILNYERLTMLARTAVDGRHQVLADVSVVAMVW